MAILVTGAGGFLGRNLIPRLLQRGNTVYGLYHKPPGQHIPPHLLPLIGNILKPDLELEKVPSGIDLIIHLAALLDLDNKHRDRLWAVNVGGTENVLDFCQEHHIPKLVFCSTAYTQGRNMYEVSKERGEGDILAWSKAYGLKAVIFKPSIIIGSPENPGTDQTINHVALTIARVHKRAETARRKVQDALALPPIELGFRIRGDPQASLNVIPVGLVAEKVINLGKAQGGVYYITNPHPPSLQQVADEVGEALRLNIHILKEFRPSPAEKLLEKLISPFLPYLQGEPHFPTVAGKSFRLPSGYIRDMVRAFLEA